AKEAKRNQQVTEVKPIRLSPVIDKHDFDTKMRHARKWIEEGMKVKVDMRFRGRLITRLEVGKKIMNSFTEEIADIANVEKRPLLEGNTMSCVLAPKKK
ncbi:MAG: translation initiation factor IF-3, partial [Longicatena sp.]